MNDEQAEAGWHKLCRTFQPHIADWRLACSMNNPSSYSWTAKIMENNWEADDWHLPMHNWMLTDRQRKEFLE